MSTLCLTYVKYRGHEEVLLQKVKTYSLDRVLRNAGLALTVAGANMNHMMAVKCDCGQSLHANFSFTKTPPPQ